MLILGTLIEKKRLNDRTAKSEVFMIIAIGRRMGERWFALFVKGSVKLPFSNVQHADCLWTFEKIIDNFSFGLR